MQLDYCDGANVSESDKVVCVGGEDGIRTRYTNHSV